MRRLVTAAAVGLALLIPSNARAQDAVVAAPHA